MKTVNLFSFSCIRILVYYLLVFFCCAQTLNAQPVTLDQTFGQNGMTVLSDQGGFDLLDFDKYGNIIAVGSWYHSSYHLTILKTDANGIPDKNFGVDGVSKFLNEECSEICGFKITNENKILIVGAFKGTKYFIMLFNEYGVIDETFGNNGIIFLGDFNFMNLIRCINLESDEFMLIGDENRTIYKYNYNGELQNDFGTNGKVTLNNNVYKITPYCIKLLNGGSMIIAGSDASIYGDSQLVLCKLKANGSFDNDFADNGIWRKNLVTDYDLMFESLCDVIEDNYGNLVVLGGRYNHEPFVCSFFSNGIINSDFGTDGFCYSTYISEWSENLVPNGSKYLTGFLTKITCINPNGTVDSTFNNSGVFFYSDFNFGVMKIQEPGKLILGSYDGNLTLTRLNIPVCEPEQPVIIHGKVTITPNPCLNEPCPPGMVYAIESESANYIITLKGYWQSSEKQLVIGMQTFEEDDSITVKGFVSLKQDIWGHDYQEIEVISTTVSIKPIFNKHIISIYPNPTTGELRILNYELGIRSVEVFDISGKKIYAQFLENTIDIGSFSKGIYLLKVYETNGQVSLFKIIKE